MEARGGNGRPPPADLDREFPLGDGTADLEAEAPCPHCGEWCTLSLDPGSGPHQSYTEDCPVCCRPWDVTVRYDADGRASVELEAQDGV